MALRKYTYLHMAQYMAKISHRPKVASDLLLASCCLAVHLQWSGGQERSSRATRRFLSALHASLVEAIASRLEAFALRLGGHSS